MLETVAAARTLAAALRATCPQAGGPDLDQLEAMLAASPDLLGVSVADYRPDGTQAAALVTLLGRILAPA